MKTIITIGRQFGSGGKEVGIRVAKELGIPKSTFGTILRAGNTTVDTSLRISKHTGFVPNGLLELFENDR